MRLLLLNLIDKWRCPPPAPARVAWLGRHSYAHRGLHGPGVPENSPAAFSLAIRAGIGIECDIQRSADDQAIVFHDWEWDRLTAHKGPVAHSTAAGIEGIALDGNGDGVPTLSRMLAQVAGAVPLLIEIKSKPGMKITPICLAVHRALQGYRGDHAVMSFDPRICRWFRTHSKGTLRGLVVTEEGARAIGGRWRRHRDLWHAKPEFLAYDIRDLPSRFAARQRKRGLPVLTWTVRSRQLAARARDHADAPIAEGEGLA